MKAPDPARMNPMTRMVPAKRMNSRRFTIGSISSPKYPQITKNDCSKNDQYWDYLMAMFLNIICRSSNAIVESCSFDACACISLPHFFLKIESILADELNPQIRHVSEPRECGSFFFSESQYYHWFILYSPSKGPHI